MHLDVVVRLDLPIAAVSADSWRLIVRPLMASRLAEPPQQQQMMMHVSWSHSAPWQRDVGAAAASVARLACTAPGSQVR